MIYLLFLHTHTYTHKFLYISESFMHMHTHKKAFAGVVSMHEKIIDPFTIHPGTSMHTLHPGLHEFVQANNRWH